MTYHRSAPQAIGANGATSVVSCENYTAVAVQVYGTYAGINLSFEASNGENIWVPVLAAQLDANTIVTATGALTNTNRGYRIACHPFAAVRVRATAYTSGTMNVIWSMGDGSEGIPAVGGHAITGTVATTVGAGTALIGDVSPGVRTTATNAALVAKILSTATTNGTVAKASAGRVYGLVLINTNAAARYFKLHNNTSVTPGTTAVHSVYALPTNVPVSVYVDAGVSFGTGICYSIVAGSADNDSQAVGAGDVTGALIYA